MLSRSPSRAHRTITGALLIVTCVVLATILMRRSTPKWQVISSQLGRSRNNLQPAQVDAILYRQGLSHNVFHHALCKEALLSFVRKHNRIAIVGVEGGNDVVHFAKLGYKVHAVEPMQEYFDHFTSISKQPWFREHASNVHWHKVAASNVSGKRVIAQYFAGNIRKSEKSTTVRLDDLLSEPLDLLSVDIQGDELDVVQGASKLLDKYDGIRSIWVEIHACNHKAPKLLHELRHHGYMLFDMVPHGGRKNVKAFLGLHDFDDAARMGWGWRPGSIDTYATWLCALRKTHAWVQADVVAIRRDLVDTTLMLRLSTVNHLIFRKLAKLDGII